MSKNYDQISNQVAAAKRDTSLVAFYANLEPVPFISFPELVQGKIKVLIDEWSKGRGDSRTSAVYNLDLPDVYYLYERARESRMDAPFSRMKIMGEYPVDNPSSPYNGMCRVTKILIERIGADGRGNARNSPWKVQIANGFGKAVPGPVKKTWKMASGSYRDEVVRETGAKKNLTVWLTDVEFLDCFTKVNRFISVYASIIGQKYIPEGMEQLKELRQKNNFQGQAYTGPGDHRVRGYREEAPSYEQNPAPDPRPVPGYNTPSLHDEEVRILTPFNALDDGVLVATCAMPGGSGKVRKWTVHFRKESVCDRILEAQESGTPVHLSLYVDEERRLWCYGASA